MHGLADHKSNSIDLTLNPKQFISYVCVLAKIYFKILKVSAECDNKTKENRRKIICNIIFNIIEHCQTQYYIFPLKALSEMFSESQSEMLLSKKLNSQNYLEFKL